MAATLVKLVEKPVRIFRRQRKETRRRKQMRAIREERSNCKQRSEANVFLTGDMGKLGTYIANTLKYDYDIVGLDIQYSAKEDLANYEYVKEKMRGCEYVVHTAAIPHPGCGTIEDYVRVNVLGTLNILKAAEEDKAKRVIFLSSTGYYGCDIKGKLWPSYFPIDEKHPVASIEGQSEGALDAYNQSKVMAEQLCAYYGTNKRIEIVVLRLGPAASKAQDYPEGFSWRENNDWRRGTFFSNCHPQNVADTVKLAIEAKREFWYEAFNIVDKYTHESIDVREFLEREYPDVELRVEFTPHMGLIDVRKAERILGFKPCEDLR